MESTTQPPARSPGVSYIGAFAGMLVTFVAGVYVGLHPSWIPIKGNGANEMGTPLKVGSPAVITPDHAMPATMPATMPTTIPATGMTGT
jgi:hypothetical protein